MGYNKLAAFVFVVFTVQMIALCVVFAYLKLHHFDDADEDEKFRDPRSSDRSLIYFVSSIRSSKWVSMMRSWASWVNKLRW